MASVKAEKPAAGSQLFGPVKKEPAKTGDAAKAPSSKSAAKKPAQKSQEPKKKAKGGKSAAKHWQLVKANMGGVRGSQLYEEAMKY